MVIFGRGMTGCLASLYFNNAKIIDEKLTKPKHKAILRFRSDQISILTGIPFKKIKVQKAVYHEAKLHNEPSIIMQNLYSKKVSGGYYNRSIMNLESETRWIAPENFQDRLFEICKKNLLPDKFHDVIKNKEPIISTLTMKENLDLVGEDYNQEFNTTESLPIYVSHIELKEKCDVNQTIYYTNINNPIYRITLQEGKFIVESMKPMAIDFILYLIKKTFGIDTNHNNVEVTLKNHEQMLGKIQPINEELRKKIIYKLTKEHNIYSMGRYSTWRNILLDDCIQDMQQIQKIMAISEYDRAIGK